MVFQENSRIIVMATKEVERGRVSGLSSGGSRGGARGAAPSFLAQTEARGAENIFLRLPPPQLSQGLNDLPPLSQGLGPPLLSALQRKC